MKPFLVASKTEIVPLIET